MDAAEDELPVQKCTTPGPLWARVAEKPDVPGPVSARGSGRGWQLKASAR